MDRILRRPNPTVVSVVQKFLALEAMQKDSLNGKMVDIYYLICLSNISDPPIGQVEGSHLATGTPSGIPEILWGQAFVSGVQNEWVVKSVTCCHMVVSKVISLEKEH